MLRKGGASIFFILTVGIDSGDEFRLREYIYNGNFCAEDMGGKLK